MIDTLVGKYCDHLPLYRQSVILERQAGLELSRATLDGWVMQVGELLMPVAGAVGRELLSGGYIQANETPVAAQMHDGRGKTIRPICVSTAGRAAVRYSTSNWGADAKGQGNSWGNSTDYCRLTAMSPTRKWAGRRWCMPAVGPCTKRLLRGAQTEPERDRGPKHRRAH